MTSIADLKPDPKNARRHGDRNREMIALSIQRNGFGRSVLTANDGTIIAGNATVEAAIAAGLVKVRTVEATGDEVIEVRRVDVEPGTKAFHELAEGDNRAAQLAEVDTANLSALIDDGLIDPDWLYYGDELDALLAGLPGVDDWTASIGGLPDGDKSPFQQMTFTISDDQAEQIDRALAVAKSMGPFTNTGNENSNGNALARICERYLTHADR
jgi:ParB family transcriptional regulator, chromosome partitioning protein